MENVEEKRQSKSSPELVAGFLSRLFYCWLNDVFKVGSRRTLEVSDLYDVVECDSSKYNNDKLQSNWEAELSVARQSNGKRKPSLRRALFKTFGLKYFMWGIVITIEETLRIAQAVLLGGLIRYGALGSDMQSWEAYLYAAGVGLCSVAIASIRHPLFQALFRFGMWMRIGCCSMIYRKALKLDSSALRKATVGHMVNLMSNDVYRLDASAIFLLYFFVAPLEIVAITVITWQYVSWTVLIGILAVMLFLPFQGFFGRLFARLRCKIASHTDERLRLTNELLNSMKIVKMYCWEKFFEQLINEARRQEAKRILKASYARAIALTPIIISPKVYAYFTFLTYVLVGNELNAEVVFVTLSLFLPLRFTLSYCIPLAIQFGSEATVTITRLEEFLLLEERKPNLQPIEDISESKSSVIASCITASWDQAAEVKLLNNVSFDVRKGELLAVIGPVGAGKSSLLMALLGELPLIAGEVKVEGRVAFASQQSWVFSASVRQNIIFSMPFDADRYGRVVQAAALTKDIIKRAPAYLKHIITTTASVPDLEMMPDGDGTLVGERGVSLSGGQKARISLARALYGNADVYLLDDPLSAVDTHVGRHIFKYCIRGFLKDKVCILVTHHIQYLRAASKILVLAGDGRARMGSFEELSKDGVDFESLIKSIEAEQKPDVVSEIGEDTVEEDPDKGLRTKLLTSARSSQEKFKMSIESLNKRKSLLRNNLAQSTVSLASQASLAAGNFEGEFVAVVQPEEVRAGGSVKASMYVKYIYYGAGVMGLIFFALISVIANVIFVLCDWWLAYWCRCIADHKNAVMASAGNRTGLDDVMFDSNETFSNAIDYDDVAQFDNAFYIYVFTALTTAVVLVCMIRAVYSFHMLVCSAIHLHKLVLGSILRSPMSFFNTNPVGRILNRFSKDLGQIEEILPLFMSDFIVQALGVFMVIIVVGAVNPWVFISVAPLCAVFLYIRHYYLKIGRPLKRIEATTKSPVFSHISSTVLGLQTIRAYRAESVFTQEFDGHQDLHTSAVYLFVMTSRWFAVRLEWLCAVFITIVSLLSVLSADHLDSSLIGLSLSYVVTLMAVFQYAVRQSTEVESLMTSVERLMEYSDLPAEATSASDKAIQLSDKWPATAEIAARNVSLRYTVDGPIVLKDLNFTIRDREKIGIVGRTGAGKSSLITVFFRLAEPSGQILVDGRDIKTIELPELRTKISIIPQDPVLLKGTLRMNLDPLDQYTDLQIWDALEQVQLKKMVKDTNKELNYEINEGGSNISVGESQLLCLARAVLKRNRLLIIDEATANVDPRTDSLIQKTIREQFVRCTVLTIAHRLNTIIDSDRIMVLDEGRIVEFDAPFVLLTDSNSKFHQMALQAGQEEFNRLLKQAAISHQS